MTPRQLGRNCLYIRILVLCAVVLAAAPAVEMRTAPLEDPAVVNAVDLLRLRLRLGGALMRAGKDGQVNASACEVALWRARGVWTANSVGAPGFNKGSHAANVVLSAEQDGRLQLELAVSVGDDQWVRGDRQATYRLDIGMTAGVVEGTFAGTFQGKEVWGKVSGTAGGSGWRGGREADGGYAVAWDFGKRRQSWNTAHWAVYECAENIDLSTSDGLRVRLRNRQPRSDAWVDVAVMEVDGTWYHASDALSLANGDADAAVSFADMRPGEFLFDADGTHAGMDGNWDEDFSLDTRRIRRIAIGVANGEGVGTVAFTILGVERASWLERSPPQPAELVVDGRTLAVNGQVEVPPGIFGFHTVSGRIEDLAPLRPGSNRTCVALSYGQAKLERPKPEAGTFFMVSGNYDRKQQLPQGDMSGKDWETPTRAIGRRLGELGMDLGRNAVVEWWNEPYLDLGSYLDGSLTMPLANDQGVKPGDAVMVQGCKLASMVWIEGRLVQDGAKTLKVFNAAAGPIWRSDPDKPRNDEGVPTLFAVDPSRFTYWSGRQIGQWYNETFRVMADEALRIAPEMRLVGGFGFRWQEDNWQAWEMLYRPLIDASWQQLDGVCEHHYQGEPLGTLAAYEVLQAYTDVRFGKRLKGYNTECNDLWDAPARGGSGDVGAQKRAVPYRRMVWNLRDIIQSVIQVPDKAAARAIHAQWPVDAAKLSADAPPWARMGIGEGEYQGLHLLRNLRGSLLCTSSSDAQVWLAASVDAQTRALVAVAYNDAPVARQVRLVLRAPQGTTFADGTLELVRGGADAAILASAEALPATQAAALELTLQANEAICAQLPLQGDLPAAAQVERRQRFADGILRRLGPGEQVRLPLKVGSTAPPPTRLWARLVLERCTSGEGWIEVGGTRIAIPHSPTIPNTPRIVDIPLPPTAALADAITIGANSAESGDGFLMCCASLVEER